MIIYLTSFTDKGREAANQIMAVMSEDILLMRDREQSLSEWVKEGFELRAPIIFIGACGIAVRSIAPFVNSKLSDSPVLVIDENKEHVIPILSGHVGGANELACRLADRLGAKAVITTASDINGLEAIDVWAKNMGLAIYNKDGIARISSKALRQETVSLLLNCSFFLEWDDVPAWIEVIGPDDIEGREDGLKADIIISDKTSDSAYCELLLVPKTICIGIGCRKDTPEAVIEKQVELALDTLREKYEFPLDNIYDCIYSIASIDLKKKEFGLNAFAGRHGLKFITYSADKLKSAVGEFSESEFVNEITGVSNVCERAAVLLAGGDSKSLLINKQANEGVTVAIAISKARATLMS